jgi:hypothetical protein
MAKAVSKPVVVNFEDTESRGGKKSGGSRKKRYPEGDYAVKVKEAKIGRSPGDDGKPRIEVTYEIVSPKKFAGKTIIDDLYLTKPSLWRLRQTLEAMKIKVPSTKLKVDPDKLVGKTCAITLEDDEYNEVISSKVTDTFLLAELQKTGGKAKSVDEDEDEDEDEEDEDEDEEDDEDAEDDDNDDDDDDDLEGVDLDDL